MSEQFPDDKLKQLLELVMLKEKRSEERIKKDEREKQWKLPSFLHWFTKETQAYNRQKKCTHRKGGRVPGPRLDYNVAMHRFITGETKIWCLNNCGWNVWNRPGWQFKWTVGMKMMQKTTNTQTTSEVPPNTRILSTQAKIQ